MNEEYDWVPFYEELANKLLLYRTQQKFLVSVLEKAGVDNGLFDEFPKGNKIPLEEIDPFTFISLITKYGSERRSIILDSVREQLNITAKTPINFSGVPNVDSRQSWLFPYKFSRKEDDIDKLWDLFEEVVRDKKITESVFLNARNVKYAGEAKLTQAIFRASPNKYIPVDGVTTSYLKRLGLRNTFDSAKEYEEISNQILESTDIPPYVHSHKAWLSKSEPPVTEGQYQQAVVEEVSSKKSKKYYEPPGGLPTPPRTNRDGVGGYSRNPLVAAKALERAGFECEVDPTHATFISTASNKQYVEAHHLVPISMQGHYAVSLDVTANVVALCPMCHRLLHHGKLRDKNEYIKGLFASRRERLKEKGIELSDRTLLSYYSKDLLDEEG